jgi:hypothetical protein
MDETQEEVAKKGARRPRKKQPRKTRRYPAKSRAVKKLHEDPVFKARRLMALDRARRNRTTPARLGVPDGWSRGQADMQRVYDGIKADLIIDRMKAEGMVDETKPGDFEVLLVEYNGKPMEVRIPKTEAGMAEAALREAVIGAISPLTHAASKVSYIRTVLEWTKKKPATDSNVNLSSEEWLDAALKDNDGYSAGEDSTS